MRHLPYPPDTIAETVVAEPLALILHWSGPRLSGIDLHWADDREQTAVLTPKGREMAAALAAYVAGDPVRWPELDLDFGSLPPFLGRCLRVLHETVPQGRLCSYGELAARAGSPKGARAVGQAMSRNPWPLVVPCHRVVGSGPRPALTGFSGSGGLPLKAWLLEHEGARPSGD